jgi:hypothetical protein
MRKLLTILLLFAVSFPAFAQNAAIRGKVSDTLENKSLSNAVVSLIRQTDSILFKFSRTNANGEFTISDVPSGKYKMLITFPRFADYADNIEIKDQPVVDLGTIALTQKAKLLEEVIVRGGQAIRIKGDTTEFAADSFVVKEGATVEDLLKVLPGFQVDSKGNITAQGQRVGKVLVDGEEFFGDDPTMATKNIGAKAVDRVQVFDTKTEQQQITGMVNPNQGKTVNIKLKEDQKKGGFGRFFAGSDFQKYHDAKGLYNRFVGKKKLSLYGSKSTISTGSLNWEDRRQLGIENDMEYDEISGYYFSFGTNDEFSDGNLRGLPNSYTAGGLFINKWNADKHGVNTSYRYNRLATENISSTLTQTILTNGSIFNDRRVTSNALNQQHALNGRYEWKIDSLASIKFTTAGTYKTTQSLSNTFTESRNELEQFLNKSEQERDNETERKQLDNQLVYRQQFKKKNRLFLATLRYSVIEDDNTGMLKAKTDFYNQTTGNIDSTSLIDQLKKFDGLSKSFGSKLTFSEPLSLKWNLVVDYSFNNNHSTSNRNTFNKSNNNKYETLDPVFSNNFELVANSNSGTAILRFIDKKTRLAFGSGVAGVQLKLHNLENNSRNTYNFFNVTPQVQFGYSFKQQTNFNINYRGSNRQPRIDQLQPIRDNNDPLNVFVGNPDLKVGFNHNISMFFGDYKVLKSRGIFLNGNYNVTNNAITNYSFIDKATGKRSYQPINTDGVSNWNLWSQWSQGQGNKKWRKYVQLGANGGKNINFINTKSTDFKDAEKAINEYSTVEVNFGLGYEVTDKYRFSIGPKVGYNRSGSSLQKDLNTNYYTYGGRADGYVLLPGKIELSSDVNVDLRQRIAAFDQNTNIIQWNGNLSRKIFKDKSGKIIFVANDILNQNIGYRRDINSNFITDDRYLRIARYFLLKFEWTFNKTPGGK